MFEWSLINVPFNLLSKGGQERKIYFGFLDGIIDMVWIGALFLKLERNTSNKSRGDLLNNFFLGLIALTKKKDFNIS